MTYPVTQVYIQPDARADKTWYKRFYHARDFFAFSRESGVQKRGSFFVTHQQNDSSPEWDSVRYQQPAF